MKGIMSRIQYAQKMYTQKTGDEPNSVYFGEHEMAELRVAVMEFGTLPDKGERARVFGMVLYPVWGSPHLAVARSEE